jgi:hypothetical protein
MLPRDVYDGLLKLSRGDREELAAVLLESLRDEPRPVVEEEEIELESADQTEDGDPRVEVGAAGSAAS